MDKGRSSSSAASPSTPPSAEEEYQRVKQRPIFRTDLPMDYQNRAGSKFGGGGVASSSAANLERRERLRRIALEQIDIEKDPYFFRNHLGKFECRLCFTTHQSEGSYLTHTQATRHQKNLAYRQYKEEKEKERQRDTTDGGSIGSGFGGVAKKTFVPIGTPQYKIEKCRDKLTGQMGIQVQMSLPQIKDDVTPRFRWMSAFEVPNVQADPDTMFLVIAAEPYANCAIEFNRRDIDINHDHNLEFWDRDSKNYWVQFHYKSAAQQRLANVPGFAPGTQK